MFQAIGKVTREAAAHLSKDAMDICLASLTSSTNGQYERHRKEFELFCQNSNISNHLNVKIESIIEFLTSLFKAGKSYSTINSARSALSHFVVISNSNHDAGKHPLTTKFMRGVFKLRPPTPKYSTTWDAKIVLDHLRNIDNESCSLKDLTLKCIMLLALCSGQRVQTLNAMKLSNMISDTDKRSFAIDQVLKTTRPGANATMVTVCRFAEDPGICPLLCLDRYIRRTAQLRQSELTDYIIISFAKPHKRVTCQTIARWLTQTLKDCNINSFFTAHSTRSASTSKAALHTDINSVIKMAGWSSAKTFARFYNKPVHSDAAFMTSVFSSKPT